MEGNFGRIIEVTFMPSAYNQKTGVSKVDKSKAVTIAYNPHKEVNGKVLNDLCTRIDFSLKLLGPDYAKTSKNCTSICNVDIWNIGSELDEMFEAYNDKAMVDGVWDPYTIKRWNLSLKIGYENGSVQEIFYGSVNSYYIERKQTKQTVDNIFHFSCYYPIFSTETLTAKGESGKDYTKLENQIGMINLQNKKMTAENFMRYVVMSRPRAVYYNEQLPQSAKVNSFVVSNTLSYTNPLKVNKSNVCMAEKIVWLGEVDTPFQSPARERFDKYFKFKYSDYATERIFKNTTIYSKPIDSSNLQFALDNFARSVGARVVIEKEDTTGIQVINIIGNMNTMTAKSSDNSGVVKSEGKPAKTWVVHNFQNLTKSPQVAYNSMIITLILEPNIKPLDLLKLTVDNNFMSQNRPSFLTNLSETAMTNFAGANNIGFMENDKNRSKVNGMKSYGNIFNNNYTIRTVDHHGSSHEAVWETRLECLPEIGAKND